MRMSGVRKYWKYLSGHRLKICHVLSKCTVAWPMTAPIRTHCQRSEPIAQSDAMFVDSQLDRSMQTIPDIVIRSFPRKFHRLFGLLRLFSRLRDSRASCLIGPSAAKSGGQRKETRAREVTMMATCCLRCLDGSFNSSGLDAQLDSGCPHAFTRVPFTGSPSALPMHR
jgi:hypothetical protein